MPKKSQTDSTIRKEEKIELEKMLVENIIELQKVHTNLAEKFDKLAKEISSLLTLFEMTARSFAEHPAIQSAEKDKEFLDKIDRLLDQNKTIARGLTLMEDRLKERVYGAQIQQQEENKEEQETAGGPAFKPSTTARPLPKF